MDLVDKVNLVIKKKTSPARQQFAGDAFYKCNPSRSHLECGFFKSTLKIYLSPRTVDWVYSLIIPSS